MNLMRPFRFIKGPISSFIKELRSCYSSTTSTTCYLGDMRVKLLPALQDNYMYLLIDDKTKAAAIVDPVEPSKCLAAIKEENVNLTHILTTHHHWDHANGNEEMFKLVENLTVCGGDDRIGALNKKVGDGDKFSIGELDISCIFTPCHTTGHICYFIEAPNSAPVVFTGDCLFIAGCGRFFEGTPQQMHVALNEKLSKLPDSTNVYCGHEYTVKNLMFATHVEPDNVDAQEKLNWAKGRRERNLATIPSTIGEEKLFNPFMRTHQPSIKKRFESDDVIEVMRAVRAAKDKF